MKIDLISIKELAKQGCSEQEILKICDELYNMTDFICSDYPKYKSWFYTKQLPETLIKDSGRDIIFARDENQQIYGTSFIKQDETEKKICTLFVSDKARGLGIGTKLVEKSMEFLGTTKPMITLADYKLPMFKKIIEKYDWQQTQVIKGLYNDRSLELVYNGYLPESRELAR